MKISSAAQAAWALMGYTWTTKRIFPFELYHSSDDYIALACIAESPDTKHFIVMLTGTVIPGGKEFVTLEEAIYYAVEKVHKKRHASKSR